MLVVLKKALRDSRRTILWLSLGFGIYALLIMSFFPSMVEQADQLDELIESYPDEFVSMFYGSDQAENISIAEPGNFVQIEFATWMVLIIGAMLIYQAFNSITNAERDGTIDVMMSLPVSRRDYILGRFINSTILILSVLTACFIAFSIATLVWEEFDVSIPTLVAAMYGAFFLLLTFAAFGYMLATLVPSSKRYAGAVAYLFLIGSYLLHSLSGAVTGLSDVRSLMVFDYYNAGTIIRDGIEPLNVFVLMAVSLIFFAIAWWRIDEKELGV